MIGVGAGLGVALMGRAMQSDAADPIKALFEAGENLLYLPPQMDALRQDRAAQVPVTAAGQTVGVWFDAYTSGAGLQAPNDAARPTYQAAGVVGDGLDDRLIAGVRLGMPADPDLTVIAALNTGQQSQTDERVFQIGSGVGSISGAIGTAGLSWRYDDGNRVFPALPNNTDAVICWSRAAGDRYSEGRCYVDGQPVAAVSSGNGAKLPSSTVEQISIMRADGGAGAFKGALRSILIVEAALSDQQIAEISSYMAG